MPPVYLGRVRLWWCHTCGVPLVREECDLCGGVGERIPVTPPGDVRPAFEGDMEIINSLLRSHYGVERPLEGCVLLNRLPGEDRMEEVIADGMVMAVLRYVNGWRLMLKPEGAAALGDEIKKGFVVADEGAREAILKGANLMAPGVVEVAENVRRGDEVVVFCGDVVATGISRISYGDALKRGVAVKLRGAVEAGGAKRHVKRSTWDAAVRANRRALDQLEERALKFIRTAARDHDLPVLVSFSGGKDSMATLLLVMKSEVPFRAFFLDTGIELPETVSHVEEVSRRYGIEMDVVKAGNAFWDGLEKFGPPGRDYRWCCKAVKLGPTVRYVLERYPGGVLTFIGQRRYESEARSHKGAVWRNEWVPNQVGASPIQNWNALEVFLYLFRENAPINPWYRRGLHRIGCYLCPASDLGDLDIVGRAGYLDRWYRYLRRYASERGAGEEWVALGLWRWSNPPPWVRRVHSEAGIPILRRGGLKVTVESAGENEVRLIPSRPVDRERLRNMANILPRGALDPETLVARKDMKGAALQVIYRAEDCIGCGICTARCERGAIEIKDDGRAWIDVSRCVHCMGCLGSCPAFTFRRM